MKSEITELQVQLDEVASQAGSLVKGVLTDDLRLRPETDHWSIAECLEHLSLSSESLIRMIRAACLQAGEAQIIGTEPCRMDTIGRLLNWSMRPPVRIKLQTSEPYQPNLIEPLEEVLPRFLSLQEQLKTEIANAAVLDLNLVKVQSPFSRWVQPNLFSCMVLIVTHQRRHLWQAENAKRALLKDR